MQRLRGGNTTTFHLKTAPLLWRGAVGLPTEGRECNPHSIKAAPLPWRGAVTSFLYREPAFLII